MDRSDVHTEIRVKEHAQVFRGYEEARDQSMDRRRELKQRRIMEQKAICREHARVDGDGREEHDRRDSPVNPMLATMVNQSI